MNIETGNTKIGEISEFCYLGSEITRDGRYNIDIRSRMGQAEKAFAKFPELLDSNINLEIRKKIQNIRMERGTLVVKHGLYVSSKCDAIGNY